VPGQRAVLGRVQEQLAVPGPRGRHLDDDLGATAATPAPSGGVELPLSGDLHRELFDHAGVVEGLPE
jgi:hypothetical protein